MMFKQRLYASLVTLLLLAGLFIPLLANVFTADKEHSASENRALAQLPPLPQSLSALAQYRDQLSNYYDDQFGFRESLVKLYYRLKLRLGDSPSNHVVIGQQGWLFYDHKQDGDPVGDYRNINIFSDSQLAQTARVLEARQQWLQQRGIAYLFVIAPNKHSIYGEYLPDHIQKVNPFSLYDQLVDHLQQNTRVNVIDLRPPLLAAKSPETPVYWQTDTHWNYYGANIAQHQIAARIARLMPGKIKPVLWSVDEFHWGSRSGGDLALNIGIADEVVDNQPVLTRMLCADRVEGDENKSSGEGFATQCDPAGLRVVIFRDSFFDFMLPLFSSYFKKATYVQTQPRLSDIQHWVEQEQPDIVIEQWAERYLRVLNDD